VTRPSLYEFAGGDEAILALAKANPVSHDDNHPSDPTSTLFDDVGLS